MYIVSKFLTPCPVLRVEANRRQEVAVEVVHVHRNGDCPYVRAEVDEEEMSRNRSKS